VRIRGRIPQFPELASFGSWSGAIPPSFRIAVFALPASLGNAEAVVARAEQDSAKLEVEFDLPEDENAFFNAVKAIKLT